MFKVSSLLWPIIYLIFYCNVLQSPKSDLRHKHTAGHNMFQENEHIQWDIKQIIILIINKKCIENENKNSTKGNSNIVSENVYCFTLFFSYTETKLLH